MIREKELTVAEIYNLVDRKIGEMTESVNGRMGEVKQSINRLADSFNNLESGRVSSLEKSVANLQGKVMMISILISTTISLFSIIITVVLTKLK